MRISAARTMPACWNQVIGGGCHQRRRAGGAWMRADNLRLCWRLQVIRERTVLAAGARRTGGRQRLMEAALRHWFWILTGLMIAGTGFGMSRGSADNVGPLK